MERTEKLGKLIKSDLPSKLGRNQNTMIVGMSNNSASYLGHKHQKHIEENLIQLEDSPKHSLRARKPNNMKNYAKVNQKQFLV